MNFFDASGRLNQFHILNLDAEENPNEVETNLFERTLEDIVYDKYGTSTNKWSDQSAKINPKKLIKVHAELVSPDGQEHHILERNTVDGRFQFLMPGFYGKAVFFLSAADSATLKKVEKKHKKYVWIQGLPNEDDLPAGHKRKFRIPMAPVSVRVDFPYVRFVKPYNYYQEQLREAADPLLNRMKLADGTIQMREVFVGAKHNGMKKFSDSIPAIIIDGYEAYNRALDCGFLATNQELIVRSFVGDYGSEYPYIHCPISPPPGVPSPPLQTSPNIEIRHGLNYTRRMLADYTINEDSVYMKQNLHSMQIMDRWGYLQANISPLEAYRYANHNLIDHYVLYTDYEPRREGDRRYLADNLPLTSLTVYPFPDGSQRMFYRDRRYVLQGYSYADDFYHPNYEQRTPQQQPEDYRRTIYWNPDLRFDSNGEATVQFYNNCRPNQLSISAEGITPEGIVLSGQVK